MHLLQVHSNPEMNRGAPLELLFRVAQAGRGPDAIGSNRRRARQFRASEIDQLMSRYLEERNVREVAREFGISRATVAKHLADRRIYTSRGMTRSEVELAIQLYTHGLSSARVGSQLRFDNHTILKALRKAGVAIRPPATGNWQLAGDSPQTSSERRLRAVHSWRGWRVPDPAD